MRAPSFADSLADRVPDVPTDAIEAMLDEARTRGGAALDEAVALGGAALAEAAVRGGAAWDALRGERVGPPAAARRWPWALAAALAGATAGIAVAVALRGKADPPDAQDPEDLEAVIDRPL
jgi:hypothetical protein